MSDDPQGDSPWQRPPPPVRGASDVPAHTPDAAQPPPKPLAKPPGYLRLRPHRGNSVLALGLTGVIMAVVGGMMAWGCCVFAFVPPASLALCIPAWVMGRADLAAMSAGVMDPSGKDSTMVGMIGGIVGVALIAVGALVVAAVFLIYLIFFGVMITTDMAK